MSTRVDVESEEASERHLFAFACAGAFGTLTGLSMTAMIVVARSGLVTPPLLAPGCVLLLASAAFAPFLPPARWRRRLLATPFAFPLLVLFVLLSPVLVFFTGPVLALLYPLMAATGFVRALPQLASMKVSRALLLLFSAAFLSCYAFSQLYQYQRNFTHVFTPEYARLGLLTLDPSLHTAIAHMIRNFGQPSTGLDGLVPIHYHVGSHTWFASIGLLTGATPLICYPLGQMIVAVPALYMALCFALICLARSKEHAGTYAVLGISIVLILDRIGWNSYYISQSYTLGLVALLLALPLLHDSVEVQQRRPLYEGLRAAGALLVVFVACSLKVSVGVVFSALFGYLIVRRHALSRRSVVLLFLLSCVACGSLWYFAPRTGLPLRESLSFLHFYRTTPRSVLGSTKAHTSFLLPAVYLALAAWKLCTWRPATAAEMLRRKKEMLRAELVLVATVVAAIPGLMLVMWTATAWWFQNVAQWFALPVLVSSISLEGARASQTRMRRAAGVLLILGVVGHSVSTFEPSRFGQLAWRMLSESGRLGGNNAPPKEGEVRAYMLASLSSEGGLFDAEFRERLRRSEGARLARLVADAQQRTPDGGFGVFVPPENGQFWRRGRHPCLTRPFIIPALTGVPMVKGLAPQCPRLDYMKGYFYGHYGSSSRSEDVSDTELCQHALERDIRTVFVLGSLEDPGRNRTVDCASARGSTSR